MMFENPPRQAIRGDEIFFFEHCAGALEQTRFVPAAVKLGAVSPKNNNQQQDNRGRSDVECNWHLTRGPRPQCSSLLGFPDNWNACNLRADSFAHARTPNISCEKHFDGGGQW